MDLLQAWAHWKRNKPPYVLDSDQDTLISARTAQKVTMVPSWPDAYRAEDFCVPKDHRLHFGLLPQPFCGDLCRASIYILLLNPGLSPSDYYGEHEVAAYRKALSANLKQKFRRGSPPFLFLDPQYSWHGGFDWWHGKLAGLIASLVKAWDVPWAEARGRLARELASIELVPYHSANFALPDHVIRSLQSVKLARRFVLDKLVPRARSGDCLLVVTRAAKHW